jgi:polyhydroxyalkanoate synthesis regulator phasin
MEDQDMRGRHPSGPGYVDRLQGSPQAKQRLRVVLETMTERCRVQEACQRLGISEQRFDQVRQQALQSALHGLESKPGGRPRRRHFGTTAEVRALRQQVADLEAELRAAHVREEIAIILPRVVRDSAGSRKKKTRRKAKQEAPPKPPPR